MKAFPIILSVYLLFGCQNSSQLKRASNANRTHLTIEKHFDKDWAQNSIWNDGQAEVAQYNATRVIYKKARKFTYTYITVSEDFNKEFNVKTDDYERDDIFKVMKVNAVATIETDNYPYHFLTSMFFKKESPASLHKYTTSSQEWCGNTFKEYLLNGKNFTYDYHSYWDGEGDGSTEIDADILMEDQLIYSLRSLKFQNGLTFKSKVLESQVSSKAGSQQVYSAQFTVSSQAASWKVSVNLDDEKTNVYYFGKDYPNILLSADTWDNRSLTLKNVSRYAYWKN